MCSIFNSREKCASGPRHTGEDSLGYTGVEVLHLCSALEIIPTPGALVRSVATKRWFLSDSMPKSMDPDTQQQDYEVGMNAVPARFRICGSASHSLQDHLRYKSGVVKTGGRLTWLMRTGPTGSVPISSAKQSRRGPTQLGPAGWLRGGLP